MSATRNNGGMRPPADPDYAPVFPSSDLDPDAVQALVEAYRGMTPAERWVVAIEGSEQRATAGAATRQALDELDAARISANVFLAVACVLAFVLGWALGDTRARGTR